MLTTISIVSYLLILKHSISQTFLLHVKILLAMPIEICSYLRQLLFLEIKHFPVKCTKTIINHPKVVFIDHILTIRWSVLNKLSNLYVWIREKWMSCNDRKRINFISLNLLFFVNFYNYCKSSLLCLVCLNSCGSSQIQVVLVLLFLDWDGDCDL